MTLQTDSNHLDQGKAWSDRLERARQMIAAAGRELGSSLQEAASGAQTRTRAAALSGRRNMRAFGADAASHARRKPASTALAVLGVGAAVALLLNPRTRKAGLAAAGGLAKRYRRR